MGRELVFSTDLWRLRADLCRFLYLVPVVVGGASLPFLAGWTQTRFVRVAFRFIITAVARDAAAGSHQQFDPAANFGAGGVVRRQPQYAASARGRFPDAVGGANRGITASGSRHAEHRSERELTTAAVRLRLATTFGGLARRRRLERSRSARRRTDRYRLVLVRSDPARTRPAVGRRDSVGRRGANGLRSLAFRPGGASQQGRLSSS